MAATAAASESGHAEFQVVDLALPAEVRRDGRMLNQLPDGRVVLATTTELLLCDSRTVERIPLPEPADVYQVQVQSDGGLLVSARTFMAVARPAPEGGWHWKHLRNRAEPQNPIWPEVYQLTPLAEGLAVISQDNSENFSAAWRSLDERWTEWTFDQAPEAAVQLRADRHLWKLTDGLEVSRWTGATWEIDRRLSHPIEREILTLTELGERRLRLILDNGEIVIVEADGAVSTSKRPFAAGTSDRIYWAFPLPGGAMAMVDQQHTAHVLRADGTPTATLDATTGLTPGHLGRIVGEPSGNLWLPVSDSPLIHLIQPLNLTRFDRFNGLSSPAVHALVRHNGRLLAGTDAGIYRLEPGAQPGQARFVPVPGPRNRVTTFLIHHGRLLVGTVDGVYVSAEDRFELIPASPGRVTALSPSPSEPDLVYAATFQGARRLRWIDDAWTTIDPPGFAWNRGILEVAPARWWMLDGAGVPQLMHLVPDPAPLETGDDGEVRFAPLRVAALGFFSRLAPVHAPTARAALPPASALAWWGETPVAINDHGVFDLNHDRNPPPLLDAVTQTDLTSERRLGLMQPLSADEAWIALGPRPAGPDAPLGWQLRRVRRGASEPTRILPAAVAAVGEVHAILPEDDILWVGGEQGLLRVDLHNLPAPARPPAPRLRPTGVLAGAVADPELPHDHRAVGFTFATLNPAHAAHTAFRSRVVSDGDEDWSPFSHLASREISRLPAGAYRFELQARNADGLLSPVTTFAFTVAPPWWLSGWGALLAVLVAAGLVLATTRWAIRRSRARELHLETLVAERTATLRASEQQLSIARDEAISAQREAVRANRAKSDFLAAMSHELRTPLNAILGFAQILRREDGLSPRGHNQLEVIDRNGQHLLQMINEVLDLSKIEADKMTLNPAPCSLRRLAIGLADTFETRATQKGLAFRLEFDSALPSRVRADEAKLRQILINLLANAVKFTRQGEVVLALTLVDERVRFEVTDTGPGISAADCATIFDPFQQVRAAKAEPEAETESLGSGLGLPISQRLAELMGGRIEVTSRPGHGSAFHFELQLPRVAEDADRTEATRITGYRGPRRRILIVDDIATNRAVLRDLLALFDFNLEEAATGAEALAAHAHQPADLIVLDLHLPDLPGHEVARRLRDTPTRPRLLAISASVFGTGREETGCDAFVPKPIEEDRVLGAIGELLQLDWIRTPIASPPKPASAADSAVDLARNLPELLALPLPTVAELEAWLDLARRADLRALGKQIESGPADGADQAFRRALQHLVRQFRTAQLREILAAAVQQRRDPPAGE